MGKEAGKILHSLLSIFSLKNLMVRGRFNRDPLASVHQGSVWFDHMVTITIKIFILWNHKSMVKILMQLHTLITPQLMHLAFCLELICLECLL